jgi:hypothetical protein
MSHLIHGCRSYSSRSRRPAISEQWGQADIQSGPRTEDGGIKRRRDIQLSLPQRAGSNIP